MKPLGYDQTPHACRPGGSCPECNAPDEPTCAGCGCDGEEMHQVGKQFVCDACMCEEEERAGEVNR